MRVYGSVVSVFIIMAVIASCDNSDNIPVQSKKLPQIIHTIPYDNESDVSPDIIITVFYDSCCALEPLLPVDFQISGVSGQINYQEYSISFKPYSLLKNNSDYHVVIKDSKDNTYQWEFKTKQEEDLPDFPSLPGN